MAKTKPPPAGGDAPPPGGDKKGPPTPSGAAASTKSQTHAALSQHQTTKVQSVAPVPEFANDTANEVIKTTSQIDRDELYERHARKHRTRDVEWKAKDRRQKRCPTRWPEITKVKIRTVPWHPPGPPKRPPRVIIELPRITTRPWVPPYQIRRKPFRPPLQRIPLEKINQPLTESSTLRKIWRGFTQVRPNLMMCQGTTACNSKKYSYSRAKGAQTGCIAIVARGLLEEKAPAELSGKDVDDVIVNGDKFYRSCRLALKCYKGKPALQLNQLLLNFYLHDNKYTYRITPVDKGVLAKHPENTSIEGPDLLELMEKRSGTNYMNILSLGDYCHFLIFGHPPDAETAVKTICYIFDPHMLNEVGQPFRWDLSENNCCGAKFGGAGILRYAGVCSFVMDFLANYGNLNYASRAKPKPSITLYEVEIIQKDPVIRELKYEVDLKAMTKHCESEWKSLHVNMLYDKKIKENKYNLASLSAVSLATSRESAKQKMKEFYQKLPVPAEKPVLPVSPEKAPEEPTKENLMAYRGEDFFLYCPRGDDHTFGRDDLIPLPDSDTQKLLHSPVDVQDEHFQSHFKRIAPGTAIIRGTRHFASMRYNKFKNFTGVACCVSALAMCQRWRARAWNEDMVDDVLDLGFNLYRDSMGERRGPIRRLVLGEIAEKFKTREDQEFKQTSKGIAVWGKMYSNNPKVFDLCRGIKTFFNDADTGILQIAGECETAIWNEGGKYYMYHPWPADAQGYRVSLQGGGKACILRFDDLQTMCEHFHTSCKDLKRRGFNISEVNVWPQGVRPEPVNNWKPIAPNKWIIRGSFHEGSDKFAEPHRNKQATPVSIAAIAYSQIVDSDEWSSDDVNEVVTRGDMLYESTIDNLEKMGIGMEASPRSSEEEAESEEDVAAGVAGTLAAADVLPRFKITEYDHVETDILDSMYTGTLGKPEPGSGLLRLKDALNAMFKENRAAVITARGSSLAVWKNKDNYYMFDPHGCDADGFPSDEPDAASALLRCKNTKDLADMILAAMPPGKDDSFNLSPVDILPSKILPDIGAPEHKLTNRAYEWMNRGTAAILMGPRGENSALGKLYNKSGAPKDDLAGRCLALPAAAAFCGATEATPPPYMHQDHMFNCLDTGADIYKKFVKKTGRKDMLPEDLTDKFEMGENTFTLEIGEPTRLPLRLPDVVAEGEGDEGPDLGEGEELGEQPPKQIKELLFKIWYDNTRQTTVHILHNDYYQLGVWMTAGGKVVVFDPAPTLTKGLLTPQRIAKGDQLRLQRIRDETPQEGEGGGDDDEEGGEGEETPETEPEFVPPESCPALMVFSTPGEFIDRLVFRGGLDNKQMIGPAWLYPVKITNELTSLLKEKKFPERKGEGDEAAETEEGGAEEELLEPLKDEAMGKYMTRCSRTTASVRGRVAQNENYYMDTPNRDNQDAANCIMAIVVDHIEPYATWKPTLIDAILKYGDRLYTMSLPTAKEPPKLHPTEVVKEFHVTSFNVKTEVTPDVVTGDMKAPDKGSLLNIKQGLKKYFEGNNHGVICCKGFCASVWKTADGSGYCYWDPHPTGPRGRASPGGAAALVAFSELDQLADTYKNNVECLNRPGSNYFTISSVKATWNLLREKTAVSPVGAVPDEGYEWKVLTAYQEVAAGRTLLRGSRPADLQKFCIDTVIQSSPSAIVAAAMSMIRKPTLWTRRTVDEIICVGCNLFAESLRNLGYEFRPGDDLLMPTQVSKRFRLGSNYVRFDLQEFATGRLEQKHHDKMQLTAAVEKFFERKNTTGILWAPPHCVAIWKNDCAPLYYLMEPHACGPMGLRSELQDDGAACVQTFATSKLMTHTYLSNMSVPERQRQDFVLYSFTASIKPIPLMCVDPPLVKDCAVPATSKVNVTGKLRRADEEDRKHPPGSVTCLDAQRANHDRDKEDKRFRGLRNASGWLVLSDGTQYLSAAHSIGCKKFTYAARNKQAMATCVMACAMSKVEDPCRWCNSTLDQILDSGNMLYQDSYLHYRPEDTKLLAINQILRKFYTPGNCAARVNIYRPRQSGSVDDNLYENVVQFLREENAGVFVAGNGDFAVALFRTCRGFYMFDPMDRDRYGRAVAPPCLGKARACFSYYPTVRQLVDKLHANIPPIPKKPKSEKSADVSEKSSNTTKSSKNPKSQQQQEKEKEDEEDRDRRCCVCPDKPCHSRKHWNLEPAKYQIYGVEVTGIQRLGKKQKPEETYRCGKDGREYVCKDGKEYVVDDGTNDESKRSRKHRGSGKESGADGGAAAAGQQQTTT